MTDLQTHKPRFRPEIFGKFTLIAPIATGGMGELFLARMHAESGFERLVVIKRILPHLTDKSEFVDMFVDEARVAAQIHHPNVCQILEFGQIKGRYYMALEYLEGISLTQVIVAGREHDKLRCIRFLISIITQVCEGLHFAHNIRTPTGALAGVVHRDVNPKNIFVTSAGVSKVIDFGIVKAMGALNVTRTGSVKGTYSYMSPEQIRATPVDRRSDVFSLGTVAWEALTGVRLFKRENDFHTWRAITEDLIPPPSQFRKDLPASVDAVLARALERDRNDRYATTRELAIAFEESITAEGGPLTPVSVASRIEVAFCEEIERQRKRTLTQDSGAPVSDDPPLDWHEGSISASTPSAPRAPRTTIDTLSDPDEPHFGSATNTDSGISSGISQVRHHRNGEDGTQDKRSDTRAPAAHSKPTGTIPGVGTPPSSLATSASEAARSTPNKRSRSIPFLFIAAIFTLAAVLFITRSKNDANNNDTSNIGNKIDNKATPAATNNGIGMDASLPEGATPPSQPSPSGVALDGGTSTDLDKATPASVIDAGANTIESDKDRRDRLARERDKEKHDKEKRDKEKRDKEKRDKEKRDKEKRDKEKRDKEKRLTEKAPKGFISVSSNPFGSVFIDRKFRGRTVLYRYKLSPGVHTVKVVTSDGRQRTKRVTIRSGKLTRVPFRFK